LVAWCLMHGIWSFLAAATPLSTLPPDSTGSLCARETNTPVTPPTSATLPSPRVKADCLRKLDTIAPRSAVPAPAPSPARQPSRTPPASFPVSPPAAAHPLFVRPTPFAHQFPQFAVRPYKQRRRKCRPSPATGPHRRTRPGASSLVS